MNRGYELEFKGVLGVLKKNGHNKYWRLLFKNKEGSLAYSMWCWYGLIPDVKCDVEWNYGGRDRKG